MAHCGLRFLNSALSVNLLEFRVKTVAILKVSGLCQTMSHSASELCQLPSYCFLSLFLALGRCDSLNSRTQGYSMPFPNP